MKQKVLVSIASAILLIALSVRATIPPTPEIRIGSNSPAGVVEHFSSKDPESAEEALTLALAHYGRMSFREAIEWASRAISLFPEPHQRALCHHLIAQSYGALGEYDQAARAANEGQRLDPDSLDLAKLRVVYFELLNDRLNYTIANEHLMRLDPSYMQNPRMDPVTGAVIIVGMVCLATVGGVTLWAIAAEEDPEVKRKLADSFDKILTLAYLYKMIVPIGSTQ